MKFRNKNSDLQIWKSTKVSLQMMPILPTLFNHKHVLESFIILLYGGNTRIPINYRGSWKTKNKIKEGTKQHTYLSIIYILKWHKRNIFENKPKGHIYVIQIHSPFISDTFATHCFFFKVIFNSDRLQFWLSTFSTKLNSNSDWFLPHLSVSSIFCSQYYLNPCNYESNHDIRCE